MRGVPSLRFGSFTFDPATLELRRGDRHVPLQPHPAQVLDLLLRNAGRTVLREAFYQEVWGHTVVEYDQSLNFCVREIRRALGDDARDPRYVETVPRRGYRFMADVVAAREAHPASPPAGPGRGPPARVPTRSSGRRSAAGALVALVGAGALAIGLSARPGLRTSPDGARQPDTRVAAARDAYLEGARLFRHNLSLPEMERAEARFEEAVAADPTFADAWGMLAATRATLSFEFRRYDELSTAEMAARQALELGPRRAVPNLGAGYVAYYGHADYATALRHLRLAERLDPGNAEVLLALGYVLRRSGDWAGAVRRLEAAYAADPTTMETGYALAQTYQYLRRYDEAERYYDRAIAAEPRQVFAHRMKVVAELQQGRVDGMMEVVRAAAGLVDPAVVAFLSPNASRVVGAEQGVPEPAWERIRTELDSATWYLHHGDQHLAAGDRSRGLALVDSARMVFERRGVATAPDRSSVPGLDLSRLAWAYATLGRREDALESLDRAASLARGDAYAEPYVLIFRAQSLARLGELDSARSVLLDALRVPSQISVGMVEVDPLWDAFRRGGHLEVVRRRLGEGGRLR